MSCKTFLPLILLLGSLGLAQQRPLSQSEAINQMESAPPTQTTTTTPAKKEDAQKTKEAPGQQRKVEKTGGNSLLSDVATTLPSQTVLPARALSNDQLLVQAKTIFVTSNSFFVKKEQLERGLLQRKELNEWGFHVVQDEKQADLILSVRRAAFQNNFPFTFTDRVSGIVVMGGTVNSLFGTVPGKIAGRLADRLKDAYKKQ
jgi:hypothetical protein